MVVAGAEAVAWRPAVGECFRHRTGIAPVVAAATVVA